MDETLIIFSAVACIAGFIWYKASTLNAPQDDNNNLSAFDLSSVLSDLTSNLSNDITNSDNNMWTPPATAKPYLNAIKTAENKYDLPTNLLLRLIYQESHFRADIISGQTKSAVGAVGIAQFMPATARQFGINPLNPMQSIDAAGLYLKQLYSQFGDWEKAVASYNWGQGNVAKKGLAKAPTETKNYYTQILSDIGYYA